MPREYILQSVHGPVGTVTLDWHEDRGHGVVIYAEGIVQPLPAYAQVRPWLEAAHAWQERFHARGAALDPADLPVPEAFALRGLLQLKLTDPRGQLVPTRMLLLSLAPSAGPVDAGAIRLACRFAAAAPAA